MTFKDPQARILATNERCRDLLRIYKELNEIARTNAKTLHPDIVKKLRELAELADYHASMHSIEVQRALEAKKQNEDLRTT